MVVKHRFYIFIHSNQISRYRPRLTPFPSFLYYLCIYELYQNRAAIIPPVYTCLTVLLHIPFTVHEQLQFAFQFLSCYTMTFKYIQQVARCNNKLFVQKIHYFAFPVSLHLSVMEDFSQYIMVFVYLYNSI